MGFCSETDASGIRGQVIVKMIGRMKSVPNPKCENCEEEQLSCLNGQVLTRENFVTGAKVDRGDGLFYTSVLCHNEYMGSFKNMTEIGRNLYSYGPFDRPLANFKYKCNVIITEINVK